MRLATVLSIFLTLAALTTSASAAVTPNDSQVVTALDKNQLPAADPGRLPLGVPWPLLLCVGYISMSLKKQLRRRGYPAAAGCSEAFADLISLRRRPPSSSDRPPAPKSSSTNP